MDPRLQSASVQYFINIINELLNANLTIISNDVKLAVTNLYIIRTKRNIPQKAQFQPTLLHLLFN